MKVDLNRLGGPTHDVEGIDFDVVKIALKLHPLPPGATLHEHPGDRPASCEDDAEMFDASSGVRLAFGGTDARFRIGEHDMDREVNVAEVWVLVKPGSARVERSGSRSSPLVLGHCAMSDGTRFDAVRAIASGQIPTAHDRTTVALVDIHATDVDVQTVQCKPTPDPNDNPSCGEPDNRDARDRAALADPAPATTTQPAPDPTPVPTTQPPNPAPTPVPPPPPAPKERLGFSLRDLVCRAATE